ncbi:MAG: bifunctional glutamate N-acetyltransferase/amino-acid acetyltransferase ArgJ [Kiritimatiellia bacterium]
MHFTIVEGGVTAPKGFLAAGVEAGVKYAGRKDVALIYSDTEAVVAGVFTTNRVAAAPVLIDRAIVAKGRARAILANSGCANACTGPQGLEAARHTAQAAAEALGVPVDQVLVCSTGVIGAPLPEKIIATGARLCAQRLSPTGGHDAASAIITTDTHTKEYAVSCEIDGKTITIGGICKGAGMIEPNMATMLAFLTTDAAVVPDALQTAVKETADASFNKVIVDGDQSTNDTFLLLANGHAGNAPLTPTHPQWETFRTALREVAVHLAKEIVLDGEGATKFVTIRVRRAATTADARLIARAIAKSPLAKTSWFGLDPNWGRIIAAAGYSGAAVDDRKTRIFYGEIPAYDCGTVASKETLDNIQALMKNSRAFDITVDLGLGDGEETLFTCDFSFDYVKINAEYTT